MKSDKKREKLYKECLDKWGSRAQMLMAVEEMGELSQAIARYLNGRRHNVEEELGDALLMLEQLKYLFGYEEIHKRQDKKIKRIRERMKKEK